MQEVVVRSGGAGFAPTKLEVHLTTALAQRVFRLIHLVHKERSLIETRYTHRMAPVAVLTLAGVLALGACATSAQRKAAENAAIQKEAAKEISRICALPEPERSAEIQRVKDEAGIVLLCGKQ